MYLVTAIFLRFCSQRRKKVMQVSPVTIYSEFWIGY